MRQITRRHRLGSFAPFGGAIVMVLAGTAVAQDVTNQGDPITGSSTNYPGTESPAGAIDNSANTKYLNFDKLNTGFTVTPTGTGIVRGLAIITANDAPERDPTSFILEGSDDGVVFTTIASGALNPPTARFAINQVGFSNSTAYSRYRVTFPTVRTPAAANSMQVAEVQLLTANNILTPGDAFTTTYTPGASSSAAETAANLWDSRCGTKLGVAGGNLGPTIVDVTPGLGFSRVSGIDIFGGNDDQAFGGRTPSYITLYGSNNGVDFTQIYTTTLTQVTRNYQDQQFTFANSTGYRRYRIELGPTFATFMQVGEIQLMGIVVPEPPANDNCASAAVVTAGTIAGSTFNATGTDISSCGSNDSADVWYSYTAPISGMIEANTFGSGTLDTTLAVYASCGGVELACGDDTRGAKSRVRWNASANQNYRIRVSGNNGAVGTFSLTIDEAPAIHTDVFVPLAYNFNGMVHEGEAEQPDRLSGFRSLSDRALRLTGTPGSIEVGLEGPSSIPYSVVTEPGVLDLVQLGDRNTVDNGNWQFDTIVGNPDGDLGTRNFVGVQPEWLPDSNNSDPQTTDLTPLALAMGSSTKIGVIYQASNGGTTFSCTLGFDNGETASVLLNCPDWFGDQDPQAAGAGVELQQQLGLYFGAGDADNGTPSVDLNVVEAVISTQSLITAGWPDFTGRPLQSITFSDSFSQVADVGIFAATIRDSIPAGAPCPADFNQDGGIDGADVEAFFIAWEGGDPSSDVNQDGGIDGGDVETFFIAWEAGGCN